MIWFVSTIIKKLFHIMIGLMKSIKISMRLRTKSYVSTSANSTERLWNQLKGLLKSWLRLTWEIATKQNKINKPVWS